MKWTITRQELALFHPKHKRIRLFYEHDCEDLTKDASRKNDDFNWYRKHAQDILETMEEVLKGLSEESDEISFGNNTRDSCKLEIRLPQDLNKEIFLAYLKYWRLCLKSEGWEEETDPYITVTYLIDHIRALIQNPDVKYEPLYKPKSTLIHLLATLPILPHWDLWGIFSSCSDKNADGANSILLGKIRECTRPVYASQLRFISREHSEDSTSKSLLGYQVKAKVCYSDDDDQVNSWAKVFFEEKDFYEYCHTPNNINHNEIELYSSYGLLIDAINTALMGGNSSQELEDIETLYYIAYRIKTSLGRVHFWHVWLRPESQDATLEQLWESWWPLHLCILNWKTLEVSLATELEQLDIAYAQEAILRDIKKTDNTTLLDELVCKYGYMLFPAKCFCTKTKVWRYGNYFLEKVHKDEIADELTDPNVKLFAGSLWNESEGCNESHKPRNGNDELCPECPSYKNKDIINDTILFHEEFHKDTQSIQRTLQHLRYRRLVEQQMNLTSQIFSINESQKLMLEAATKSAISQVMARNSSHNIGSHVMNKLIGDLSKIKFDDFENYSSTEVDLYKGKTNEAILLDQLAIFNNYVKCRMDYLSDITFGTPLMQTTKKINGDLFKELDKVRLLLENISGLSEFHYKIQFRYEGKEVDESLSLALPNDILGCQALYNIIENVIRNTAKHSRVKEDVPPDADNNKTIIFTINIREIGHVPVEVDCGEYYHVEIFDNVPVVGDKAFEKDEDRKGYLKDVYGESAINEKTKESISNIDYLVYSQNKKLNESILQVNKSLRASALGLIEMEASACYLRKLDISNIENDAYNIDYNDTIYNQTSHKLNIVKAFKAGENENNLGYRFFMLRPAELLVITNIFSDVKFTECKSKWLKLGVKIESYNDFKKYLEAGGVYNHQFLVYEEKKTLELIDSTGTDKNGIEHQYIYKTALPLRILEINDISNKLNNSEAFDNLENYIWTEWEKKLKEKFNYSDLIISNNILDINVGEKLAILFDHIGEGNHNEIQKANYAEALSSNAQQQLPNFHKLSKDGTETEPMKVYIPKMGKNPRYNNYSTYCKIAESTLFKVLVIDERIQNCLENNYLGIRFGDLYQKSNIIVPGIDYINLSGDSITKDDIKKSISNVSNGLIKNMDFILIHYGILERAFGNVTEEIKNYLQELAANYNIVITSGRGTPEGLPIEVRFINLSSVINAFIDVRSKYLVNYILHSSRKSNKYEK